MLHFPDLEKSLLIGALKSLFFKLKKNLAFVSLNLSTYTYFFLFNESIRIKMNEKLK